MDSFECPYCGQPKTDTAPSIFSNCRFCGFRSALIDIKGKCMLIIDREMPYLKRRLRDLADLNPDKRVIVDRRIVQDPQEGPDRRRASDKGSARAPVGKGPVQAAEPA